MTDLYVVVVEHVAGSLLELRLTPTQPDCCPFYTTPLFALGVLTDVVCRHGDQGGIHRLDELVRSHLDPSRKHLFFDYTNPHGKQVEVWDVGCADFDAGAVIRSVEVDEVQGLPWAYGDADPSALYRLRVREESVLEGLPIGKAFGSTAYDARSERSFVQPWLR